MSVGQRCGMVSKEERLSIRRQCVLLGLCRATFYYTPARTLATRAMNCGRA